MKTFLLAALLPMLPTPSAGEMRAAEIIPRKANPDPSTENADFSWEVTEFTPGCSSAVCGLRFDASAEQGYVEGAPAFKVLCGPPYGRGWTECRPTEGGNEGGDDVGTQDSGEGANGKEESKVQALWVTEDHGSSAPYKIMISHVWSDGQAGAQFNATGSGSTDGGSDDGAARFEVKGEKVEKNEEN